ncbi:hypothetical protein D3C87_1722710 [compost metagenome]
MRLFQPTTLEATIGTPVAIASRPRIGSPSNCDGAISSVTAFRISWTLLREPQTRNLLRR